MIRVEDLSVGVGEFRLAKTTLELAAGRTLVILGPTGSGKTVLLETLMGVHAPDTGRVLVDGRDVSMLPPEARGIAYIPQDLALFPHLGVRDNILFALSLRTPAPEDSSRLEFLVEALELWELLDRPDIHGLSGGEQQRVALARALLVEPRVLFLDEPFSSLDRVHRLGALELLHGLQRRLGITMVHVTHDFEEASLIGDDVVVLVDGRVVQHGAIEEVFARPANRAVASFLLVRNILASDHPGLVIPEPRTGGRTPWVAIRPERIVWMPEPDARPNCFEARVEGHRTVLGGLLVKLRVDEALRLEAFVPASLDLARSLRRGERRVVHLPQEALIPLES